MDDDGIETTRRERQLIHVALADRALRSPARSRLTRAIVSISRDASMRWRARRAAQYFEHPSGPVPMSSSARRLARRTRSSSARSTSLSST